MSQPVPGWYPDPAGSPRLRWWNGGIWTDQYLPMPGTQPQQGTPAPMRGVPLPYNAAMQQGAPQAQGASCPQATPTQQGTSSPHVPSSQQAPKVHSNPYQNTGITPINTDSEPGVAGSSAWLLRGSRSFSSPRPPCTPAWPSHAQARSLPTRNPSTPVQKLSTTRRSPASTR